MDVLNMAEYLVMLAQEDTSTPEITALAKRVVELTRVQKETLVVVDTILELLEGRENGSI
jgi:hypothetical protein